MAILGFYPISYIYIHLGWRIVVIDLHGYYNQNIYYYFEGSVNYATSKIFK